MDLIESGKLATDAIQFFVLDEADRLLDTGNLDTILKMYSRFPKGNGAARLQVCFLDMRLSYANLALFLLLQSVRCVCIGGFQNTTEKPV